MASDSVNGSVLGWSTSYQAGSSSAGSRCSSDEETEDETPSELRGRAYSQTHRLQNGIDASSKNKSSVVRDASWGRSSGDSGGSNGRRFTRSRSPAITRATSNLKASAKSRRHMSPSTARAHRLRNQLLEPPTLLPSTLELQLPFPLMSRVWAFSVDWRKFGESTLIFLSLIYAASRISAIEPPKPAVSQSVDTNLKACQTFELCLLALVSFLYFIWTHGTLSGPRPPVISPPRDAISLLNISANGPARPVSPRLFDARDIRRISSPSKDDFGYIWMSVPKNYRESRDDGVITGLLLGPLIACGLLSFTIRKASLYPPSDVLPKWWRIESPSVLSSSVPSLTATEAVLLSRYSLVDLSTFCSTILLLHVCASWWLEGYYSKSGGKPEGERASVPRSEGRRALYYILFALAVSVIMLVLRMAMRKYGIGLWIHLNYFEILVVPLFYQFALYVALRLAHRGFTLGELGLVCFGGTALCLEMLNLTIARIWPITTPFIKTYRLPTPLLIFQVALIAGSFLTGFLLSPFLVLSRNNAQRPVHRLRYPAEKQRNRRYYALGFYVGAVLIVGGLIGFWTRWCLGGRDPWLWVVFRLLEGKKKWSRPALLSYWALLGCISVAGWNRQLARTRRFKLRNPANESTIPSGAFESPPLPSSLESSSTLAQPSPSPSAIAKSFPNLPTSFANLPNLPNGTNVSNVATDLLDAADKHVPTLGLNARRKFFHGLAVVMFVPGVAVDPAFTHLSFSAAFALFMFTEYVRYFAIHPFGASVHLFMNEFLDHRDGGTAILSHFYLLTGCAGSLWLEGPSQLLQFMGILTLGVGDAAASIVGRRIGIHRWSPTTSKTVEGSLAFVVSITACAFILRICGYTEQFSTVSFLLNVVVSAVLEALSDQNDNLTLPLYLWSMLVLGGIEY